MTEKALYWGDGTSDTIIVSFSGDVGSSQMMVASTPNYTVSGRTVTIKMKTIGGTLLGTLTVTQEARSSDFSADFNADFGSGAALSHDFNADFNTDFNNS